MFRNKRIANWLPFIFSVILATALFYSFAVGRKIKNNFSQQVYYTPLFEAGEIIEQFYVDSIKKADYEANTIEAMVDKLDPHSRYIPPQLQEESIKETKGHFKGLGFSYDNFNDTLHVLQVLANAPAGKADIQIADKIITINGKSFVGKNCIPDSVRAIIKKGDPVQFGISRNNLIKNITVTPQMVSIPSVDNVSMLTNNIGYIKINTFTELTYEDCMQGIESLLAKKMDKLIIDLRNNGGGLLDEAVSIMDMLVGGEKILCTIKGAHTKEIVYQTRRDGIFENEKQKMVILVNELTASASECMAGALQDLDRAYVIGTRTFGKGLVMEDFTMKHGGVLRLTTGRYYLPSGRCIQKPYNNGQKERYDEEIITRIKNSNISNYQDTANVHETDQKPFKTALGRTVYEQEGITPDIYVKENMQFTLVEQNNFNLNKLAYKYYLIFLQHNKIANENLFIKNFVATNDELSWLNNEIELAVVDINKTDIPVLLKQIALQSTMYKWGKPSYYKALALVDKPLAAAINYLNN
jgi:carboxyl-terminal processing protease